ncbi:ubiquitin conjugating enzyme [Aspergillus nomiae NRRL 13137]|uniref:Ubiquitin conjugating enzyme n=1 Tax=Aspergillus nomiae NRRL (strain ATCC 15546 / NRRL 13137 / CBS 260.88 / M93) TaxID=1509407 RepID=A0A0L1J962_ASPN3|nr:ubiquitin conjugating enzyme [Aspergillus nomiae NRRL 13137]KNG88289.1 ubiquitin conjugating enzyme [Aspergillus nomiae NRRL 13137]
MSDQALLRITREIKQIQQGADLSLAVTYDDSDIRTVRALILGPPETPYQFGFFEFTITFGKGLTTAAPDYPAKPPSVRALTTNKGRCRFNPNIYASGKVCLSILGTWRGEPGEEWSSAQGLESILISIQSLLSNNPYENEPGEGDDLPLDLPEDMLTELSLYAKIRHENLRIAVIEPLELSLGILPNGSTKIIAERASEGDEADEEDQKLSENDKPVVDKFADLRKRRFLWYFGSYIQTIDTADSDISRKRRFQRMPFESQGNTMDGHFDYPELRRRIVLLREKIICETHNWFFEGIGVKEQELGIASNLQRQYEHIVEDLKRQRNFAVDLELVDTNLFLWAFTYFGRPMSHLDGGIFKFKIYISPRFPEEQPRVFVETPIFHIRVSREGVLCYFPRRTDEMRYHIEAIVAALEEESPPYDPRTTVHPEATKLFWGTPEDRKIYYRALRRSVEKSAE